MSRLQGGGNKRGSARSRSGGAAGSRSGGTAGSRSGGAAGSRSNGAAGRSSNRRRGGFSDADIAALEREGAETLRRAAAGLAGDSVLQAEMEASALLGDWDTRLRPHDREALEAFGTAMLRRLGAMDDPDVFAYLLAIAAIAEPPFHALAGEAVARMRAAGVPEPVWGRSVGSPVLVDAWISTDPLEDQSNIVGVWVYGGRPHGIVVMIDHNFRGLIRRIGMTEDPDGYREDWRATSGMAVQPLSEQELADRLANGVKWYERYVDPPVYDEVPDLIALIRARLRTLPPPRSIKVREVPEDERKRIVDEFAASSEAEGLGQVEDGRRAAEVARAFVDFACDYGAGDPLRWSPIAVEMLMADWLPRKAILPQVEIDVLPDVLRAFVRYCARLKRLAPDDMADTLEAIDTCLDDFTTGMADDQAAGPAKQLARELMASGIDVTDPAAIQDFIDRRNEELGRHRR